MDIFRLNPFFVRSSFQTPSTRESIEQTACLNPFFVRSSFQTLRRLAIRRRASWS